ncbi:MAG: FmdB family zinc ribbon protein [bacterium]
MITLQRDYAHVELAVGEISRRRVDVPTYEYECKNCGLIFESEQRIVDPPLSSCPTCGGSVERLISRCSFVLKGDGWYVTDYPSKDRKKGTTAEKGDTKKPEAKSESEVKGSQAKGSQADKSSSPTDKSSSPASVSA